MAVCHLLHCVVAAGHLIHCVVAAGRLLHCVVVAGHLLHCVAVAGHLPTLPRQVPVDVFGLVDAHCSTLLGDESLLAALNASRFTVALVDVIANECSLAVAHLLELPVVGYWGFPFQGGEVSVNVTRESRCNDDKYNIINVFQIIIMIC